MKKYENIYSGIYSYNLYKVFSICYLLINPLKWVEMRVLISQSALDSLTLTNLSFSRYLISAADRNDGGTSKKFVTILIKSFIKLNLNKWKVFSQHNMENSFYIEKRKKWNVTHLKDRPRCKNRKFRST